MLRRTILLLAFGVLMLGGLVSDPALRGQGKDKDDKKDKDEIRLRQEVKRLHEEIEERNRALKIKDKQLDAVMDRLRDADKESKKYRAAIDDLRDDLKKLKKDGTDSDKLAAQVKQLAAEVQRLRAAQEGEMQDPPVGKVTGTIKKLDAAQGACVLSIGSDAGLKKGHTLEVYRTKPELIRLGVVQIIDVQANQATARIRYRPKGAPAMQTGDLAADEVREK